MSESESFLKRRSVAHMFTELGLFAARFPNAHLTHEAKGGELSIILVNDSGFELTCTLPLSAGERPQAATSTKEGA